MASATKTKGESNANKEEEKKIQNVSSSNFIFHIDMEMWRFKLHYFLIVGGEAATFPFVPDFATTQIGISTTALAVILMVEQFLFIVTKPLIGYLADYFNKLKAIISTLTILQGVCFFLIFLIPNIKNTDIKNNTFTALTPCFAEKDNTTVIESLESVSIIKKLYFHNDTINILRGLLINNSENQLKECYTNDILSVASTSLTTVERREHTLDDSQCCRLQLIAEQEINFRPCLLSETIDCESICACRFAKKTCLCLFVNASTGSAQEFNSTTAPMQCICYGRNGCSGNFPTFPKTSIFSFDEGHQKYKSEFKTFQFWLFAFFHTIAMACNNAVFTLSDTACCESVEKAGADFGRQRLWGAIGWGLLAFISGLLHDYTGNYLSAWIIMEIFLALAVWNVSKLKLHKPDFSKSILKDVGRVLKSGEFLVFEAGLFMSGVAAAMIWYYIILFLISIGASKLLCGLAVSVRSFVGSIPLMFFSGQIIKKIGHLNVLSLALFMYTIRFLWYSYLYNPWLVLFVEFLHGFTYGLLYANIASFGKASSKPGTEATTQSVLFCTHEGLGGGVGCVLGGLGLDYLGGRQTCFIASLFTACGLLLHQFSALLVRRRKGTMKITPVP